MMQNGTLPLSEQTLKQLKWKQPQGSKANPGVLLSHISEEIDGRESLHLINLVSVLLIYAKH